MALRAIRTPARHARRTAAHLVCGGCGEKATVSTRRQLTVFEEAHGNRCGASWVSIDLPLTTVLELPPY